MDEVRVIAFRDIARDPMLLLAFGFGSGLSPWAPGTVGSVVALLFMPVLAVLPLKGFGAVILLAFVAGIFICGHASNKMRVHDHGGIVWDEFVGLWITLFAAPANWLWWLAGFALFRLFDIVKPWPIHICDKKIVGGFGIMLDDVLAGACAWLVLNFIILLF